jgi:hypothetical protein
MPLTLRPTGLSSPAYRNWLDYVIVADGRAVGRVFGAIARTIPINLNTDFLS